MRWVYDEKKCNFHNGICICAAFFAISWSTSTISISNVSTSRWKLSIYDIFWLRYGNTKYSAIVITAPCYNRSSTRISFMYSSTLHPLSLETTKLSQSTEGFLFSSLAVLTVSNDLCAIILLYIIINNNYISLYSAFNCC